MDNLKLEWYTDDDTTGELRAEVTSGGFSGRSSAWFWPSQVKDFAQQLQVFPLPPEGTKSLEGGFWTNDSPAKIEETHLSIRFYPIGRRGIIGCAILLREPLNSIEHSQRSNVVDVEWIASYQQLAEFANSLNSIAANRQGEVILGVYAG